MLPCIAYSIQSTCTVPRRASHIAQRLGRAVLVFGLYHTRVNVRLTAGIEKGGRQFYILRHAGNYMLWNTHGMPGIDVMIMFFTVLVTAPQVPVSILEGSLIRVMKAKRLMPPSIFCIPVASLTLQVGVTCHSSHTVHGIPCFCGGCGFLFVIRHQPRQVWRSALLTVIVAPGGLVRPAIPAFRLCVATVEVSCRDMTHTSTLTVHTKGGDQHGGNEVVKPGAHNTYTCIFHAPLPLIMNCESLSKPAPTMYMHAHRSRRSTSSGTQSLKPRLLPWRSTKKQQLLEAGHAVL